MLTIWAMDLNTKTLTLTFDETVDVSTLDPTGITIQDAATATTSFTLTGGTTTSPNGTTIVITLLDADIPNFSGFTTFFLTTTSAVVDDLLGNSVVAIVDGSGLQAGSVNNASSGGRRRTTEEATTTTSSSSGGSSSSSSTSDGSVLGASTSRSTSGEATAGGSALTLLDDMTNEIVIFPIKTISERRDFINKIKSNYGEKFGISKLQNGVTAGKNETDDIILINSALNSVIKGTEIPQLTITSEDHSITIKVDKEVVFVRPVSLVLKNFTETDWKKIHIQDKEGKNVSSFILSQGVLLIRTNYLRDLTITITSPVEASLLEDAANDREKDAILRLMERGIVSGHPDGTFRPNDPLKRSETAKLVALIFGMKPDDSRASDEWYSAQQRILSMAGIIKGTISPETLELRANFLALIAKAKGININTLPACTAQTFSDVAIDTWYCGLVQYAQEQHWIEETSGTFDPSGIVTRSWAAGVLDRAF